MRWWIGAAALAASLLLTGCPEVDRRFDTDGDGWEDAADCAPEDPDTFPDADDPYGDGLDSNCDGLDGIDADGDGFAAAPDGEDCDDADAAVHPDAVEIPDDDEDNDCADGDLRCDADGDGVLAEHPLCGGSDCDDTNAACTVPEHCADADGDGQPLCLGDCDDFDPARLLGNPEVCDGLDNDCNAEIPPDEADEDGDGVRGCEGDCDDDEAAVQPGASELCDGLDDDCDGVVPEDEVDADGDGWLLCDGDCDDEDEDAWPGADETPYDGVDQDCDGADVEDVDGDGYLAPEVGGDDCDDGDPAVHPGAGDAPDDGLDANCDGIPGVDADGDGYADWVEDCDDDDPAIHPGAIELCDGVDQDCDGVPSALNAGDEADADGDGFLACAECDDDDGAVFPGAVVACDGVDTDCDGSLEPGDEDGDADGDLACDDCDDADPSVTTLDADADGWTSCAGDCDDGQTSFNPAATDIVGDVFDQNCDGVDGTDFDGDGFASLASGGDDCDDTDDWLDQDDADGDGTTTCTNDCDDDDPDLNPDDADGDGYTTCAGDCDDAEPTVHGAAAEVCDGLDNDCDPTTDEAVDDDGDGQAECDGDCDDDEPVVFAGNPELCDLLDNDCDGDVDEGTEADDDGDGWLECQGDCDDTQGDVFPFAREICDGLDDDCDGVVPATEDDADGDGYRICEGDCDDAQAWTNPGATELTDGFDNDCDGDIDVAAVTCDIVVPTDHATVQGAIDAASNLDVVCVEPGTYVENIDFSGKSIALRGVAGPGMTTLDGGGVDTVVRIATSEGPQTLLAGFTITGGYGDVGSPSYGGGGVFVHFTSPVLRDLWVTANVACSHGGGMEIYGGAWPRVSIERVRVTDNAAVGPCYSVQGGGLYLNAYPIDATDLLVANNSSETDGGGIYTRAELTCERCVIADNVSGGAGGGIHAVDTLALTRSHVSGNEGATGDGVVAYDALTLDHSVVAGHAGDAVALFSLSSETATIAHAVFADNGTAVDCWSGTVVDITSSVLAGNDLALDSSLTCGQMTVVDSTFYDNLAIADGLPSPVGSSGNLAADPLFLDTAHPNPRWWDLHLEPSSLLVDAASDVDPDGSPGDIGLYGGPDAGGFDLDGDGFFEWWQPGPYDPVSYPVQDWDCDDGDAATTPDDGC
jgi:predicted outer membrane repeat protein